MKKISLFLTLTMLCSMLVMPIHSSAAGTIFEEDFDSYESVSDIPISTGVWEWGDNPSSEKSEIVTEEGGNKVFALKLTSDTNSIWLDRRLSSSSNEILKIKMSVKTDTTALRIPLSVYGAGGDFMFAIFLDGKIKTLNGEQTEFASYEANKWYDLETDFNFETKTYDITVIDEAGTKSVTENVPFGNASMSNIDRIRLQCWDNLNGNVFFDDFSAESYVKESEVIPAGAISDNFNSYNSVSDMSAWNFSGAQDKAEVVSDGSDKALALHLDSATDSIWAIRPFTQINTGNVKIKTSVKTDNTGLTVPLGIHCDSDPWFVYAMFTNGVIKTEDGTGFATYEANQWYKVEADFNLSEKTYNVTITGPDGVERETKDVPFRNQSLSAISSVWLQCWSKIDANAYFDDFYVEQYYKAPSLPTSKVKVYDSNNEVVENWNSIPSDISSISLDFSTPMKSSSFTTDTVKLTNTSNNENVSYMGTLDGSVYTIVPSSLAANTTYNLVISKDIENISGAKMAEDVTVVLTTREAVIDPPASPEPETSILVNEKFDNYSSVNDLTNENRWYWGQNDSQHKSEIKTEGENKVFALNLDSSTDNISLLRDFDEVTDKYLKVSVDVKSSDTELAVPISINDYNIFVMFDHAKIKANDTEIMSYEANKWYNITAYFDIAAKTYDVVVTDDNGQKHILKDATTNQEKIENVKMQCWAKRDATASFDNLYVEKLDEKPVVEDTPDPSTSILVDEQFDNYSSVSEMTNENRWYWGENNSQSKSEIKTEGENKIFALNLDAATDNISLLRDFDQVADKYLRVSVDAKSSDTELTVPISINDYNIFVMFDHAKIKANDTEIMSYEANKWYNITAYFDIAAKTYDVVVTDDNGQKHILKDATTNQEKIENVKMQCWAKRDATASFDNLYVEKLDEKPVIEDTPTPSAKLIEDDFEAYNTVNDMSSYGWGENDSKAKAEITTENNNKVFALKLDENTDSIWSYRGMNKVSDKCLKVSVDVKSSDAGLTVPLGVTTNDGDLRYVMMNGGNLEVENGPQIMAYEAGKWYNITAYFDFTTKTYDIVVTDENGKIHVSKDIAFNLSGIDTLRLQCWSKKNATAYFDNLLVEQLDKKPVIEEEPGTIPDGIDITDDFESYNTVNDMGVYGITGKELSSVVEEAGNKFFRLGLNSETDSIWAERSFVKVDEGILNVKTRFRSSDPTLSVPLSVWSSNDKSFFYILVTEGKIYAGDHAKQLAPLKVDTWYDVDAVFNLNTKTYTVSISDGTDTIKSGNLIFGNTDMTDINSVRMQCWSKVNANADFDNLSIKSSMAVPEITENSVTFYNANGDATNELTNVSTGTSKIVIDFKTYMDADSLDGIKLINKKTNTEVAVTAQKTQKTYEMVLDKLLEGNTTYALIIPGTVKNRNDIALGEDKTVTFITESSAGGLSVKIANISNGEQEVSTLTDLIAAGAATTISLNYQNGTEPQNDTNICVITSYYSGERLVKTSVMNKTVSKDTVNTVLKYDMPIENKDGVDCIKVFVWDTVNNMKPYCKNAVFK